MNSRRKYTPQEHGRAAHYYRKVALQRYSEQPSEGLGLHRLPHVNLRRQGRTAKEIHPAVWAVVLLAIAVFFFICVMTTIALGRIIF
ncbi:MAG: hypothetical protein JXJ17_17545 [Anaerolineae bacterium]|nr:hypothetical protein [Anaerolineae bacterium]